MCANCYLINDWNLIILLPMYPTVVLNFNMNNSYDDIDTNVKGLTCKWSTSLHDYNKFEVWPNPHVPVYI